MSRIPIMIIPPPASRLLSLPLELQKDIIESLDIPSKLCLRLTNHHLQSLIPCATHPDLLVAEQTPWARRRGLYACMDCRRLRSSRCFADAMKKGPKGLNGKEPHKRFCVDCGLKPKWGTTRYSPGAEIEVEGKKHVWCKACELYKDTVACRGSGLCKGCHGPVLYCSEVRGCLKLRLGTSKKRKRGRPGWRDYDDYDDDLWLDDDGRVRLWED